MNGFIVVIDGCPNFYYGMCGWCDPHVQAIMLRRPQCHIPLSIPISHHLSYLPIHLHHLYGRQHNHALSGYESNRCGEFLSIFFTFAHSIPLIAYHCCIHVVFLALTSILSPPIENEAQLPRRSPLDLSEITNAATATSWLPLGSPIYTLKSILIQVTNGRNWSRWSSLLPLTKDLVSPMPHQSQAFEVQMLLTAANLGKCVSVHAVRAWGPMMDSMRMIRIRSKMNRVRKNGFDTERISEEKRRNEYYRR